MKKLILILALLATYYVSFAQTWEEIQKSPDIYICSEGHGATIDEADLQSLSTVAIQLYSFFERMNIDDTQHKEHQEYIINIINTYIHSLSINSDYIVLSDEPDAHVARWIKKTEIGKIFESRKEKVIEYVNSAEIAESKGKIDVAIRDYYWAYALLKTLPVNEIRYISINGEEQYLVSWIPQKINEIFESIAISVVSRHSDYLELNITYKDKPVTGLDYSYFNGKRWSTTYSAKDGKGILELDSDNSSNTFMLKIEQTFKEEAHIDAEVYSVMNVIEKPIFRKSHISLNVDPDTDESSIRTSMDRLFAAIQSKNYDEANDLFTSDALDMYRHLIVYGNAKIIGEPTYSVHREIERVVVRSIPMSFSHRYSLKKTLIDDVVFVFNPEGKITSLALGLESNAIKEINSKQVWPDYAKSAIIEFLENYKTAFILKDLDYIRAIFDENTVVHLGKPVKTFILPTTTSQNIIYRGLHLVKNQYLKNLERCFASRENTQTRFANINVIKAGRGGEIYGIQIKQDYYSPNYGDSGHVFFLLDLNDPQVVKIRFAAWQDELGSDYGLHDISDIL